MPQRQPVLAESKQLKLTVSDRGTSLIRLRSMPSFLVRQPGEGMA